ncbi:hypothetical protein [Pseudoalteromonas rubra]|uniref:hypothetical protein n=1 Tax=Pseudoalteromonas rubra TaxID=43658 RepID=UPI002DB57447|nr:hypothetical protein [Pseudoalteromonas rubra]MEC4091577.1 hypothetical protein [Pseudoalteromonas rubra]
MMHPALRNSDDYRRYQQGQQSQSGQAHYAWRTRDQDDDQFASKVFGDITRADWADYQQTFMPIHNQFKDAVMGDQLTQEQLSRIPININRQYSLAEAEAKANLSRMGVTDSTPQRTDLSKALSRVHAENQTRQHGKQRSLASIAGANISPQQARNT